MHITKTGGVSIENAAKCNGILWGRFDPIYKDQSINWHMPLSRLDKKELIPLLDNYVFFTVVRNPYDRCVSEFYCNYSSHDKNVSIKKFNLTIRKLTIAKTFDHHWEKQHLYTHLGDKQIIKHIIRFENLKSEFDNLMLEYGLNFSLNEHDNKSTKIYKVSDLDKHSIDHINKLYEKDFKLFGYPKLE